MLLALIAIIITIKKDRSTAMTPTVNAGKPDNRNIIESARLL